MPPLSAIAVPALRDLAEQLRFAPRDAILRDVERAELLAGEIDASGKYPTDWIVFRVTGYRADAGESAAAPVSGSLLLADLSAFVERLCDATRLVLTDLPGAVSADQLAANWKVSRKTLDRYRRRGLVARRVRVDAGRAALVFMPAVVERFATSHPQEIVRATAFSRIAAPMAALMLRRAARYHESLGWSLNHTAQHLATRFQRSHEAVRQVLRRADQRAKEAGQAPVFDERGPVSPRDRRVLWRCWLRAIEPGQAALRLKCSRASAWRAINLERAAHLTSLLSGPLSSATRVPPKVQLEHPSCSARLGDAGATNVPQFLADAEATAPVSAADEHARIAGFRFLRVRAAQAIRQLDRLHPSAEALDAIETDLRWSSRIMAELIRAQLGLVVATLRTRLDDTLPRLEPHQQRAVIHAAMRGLLDAVEAHDPTSAPGRGGRLAGAASLGIDRAVVRWMKDAAVSTTFARDRSRAATRLGPVTLSDWARSIDAWQAWLEPDRRVRETLPRLSELSRRTLAARYGWSGAAPMNAAQLGTLLALPRVRAAQIERRALREALALARGV